MLVPPNSCEKWQNPKHNRYDPNGMRHVRRKRVIQSREDRLWHRTSTIRCTVDIRSPRTDMITEMDRQLAKIRKAPSKIIDEKRRFIVLIDMSNFKPEDIEVILEKGRLTVKASQEVMIDSKTSIEKHFLRKFSIPDDVRDEFVATELDKYVMLKITLLRK
ncbi:hypothetical protein QR680_002702 [Steinernema hermaphroditum]|uniref:SHSP domain-containing protein n=1 Tax=Steinernema hermaphroditum TaxID=289476 RepID=A0AA39LI74_9BILA|nr:hypothetical protein QR680_002702 [Steinernema hermaphroditum]